MRKRISVLFFAIVALLSLCFSGYADQAAPSAPNHIMIYGDTGANHDIHRQMVVSFLKLKPEAVFHTGDMVDDPFNPENWAAFYDITDHHTGQQFQPQQAFPSVQVA